MKRTVAVANELGAEELVARALFQVQHPYQKWENSKPYLKASYLQKATKAMKDNGYEGARLVRRSAEPLVVLEKSEVGNG